MEWRGNGELEFNGYRVLGEEEEKALETDGDDGHTTMWMYHWTVHLKIVKMVKRRGTQSGKRLQGNFRMSLRWVLYAKVSPKIIAVPK